ncbi:MAG: Cof-type HAD-IIB family hydrolase [Chloroflexota bacterium]
MSKIRLIVVDVDGTLIGASGEPSPRVREAVHAATAAGVPVSLCSGRPLASCGPIARALGLRGPHVTFNGALVKDPNRSEVVLEKSLPPDALDRLIVEGRRAELCLELYTRETHFVEKDWRESRLHAISIRVTYEISSFDRFFGRHDVIKAQIITSDARNRLATRRLAEEFAGQLGFSIAIPMAPCEGMECVNVVDPAVSKGAAVRALIGFYGLTRAEVMGVGDAKNDLPMFEEVGRRVAMGNADPEVKAMADLVCPGVEEDGLAFAIEGELGLSGESMPG